MQTTYHVGRGDISGWARGTTPAVRPQEMRLSKATKFVPVAHISQLRESASRALLADAPRESMVMLDLAGKAAPAAGEIAEIVDASIAISERINSVLMRLGRAAIL